ncbi:MAG: CapA family protein [Thermoleophilia bacterium]
MLSRDQTPTVSPMPDGRGWRAATVAVVVAFLLMWYAAWASPAVAATRVTLAFAGDLLMHVPIGGGEYDPSTGRYDFGAVFAPIAPYLSEADYTVANLETRLAGAAHGYHGYPSFNTPDDLAPALRAAGIDALGTANNHSLDMGWEGVVRTLDVLDGAGLRHAGTARSPAERDAPCLVDVGGVRVALLNYTDYLNGIPLPSGRPYAVNVLSVAAVATEAARARAAGAELVVAFVHWGSEYQRTPSPSQTSVAPALIDAGVDLIVGHHPHVVQPIARVRGSSGREGFVAYSLGNFVSAQRSDYRDCGLLLFVDVLEDGAGARVTGLRYLPVYVQKTWAGGRTRYRVLPVHPDLPSGGDLPVSSSERWRMGQVWEELTAQLGGAGGSGGGGGGDGGVPGVVPYQPRTYDEAALALVDRGVMHGYPNGDLGLQNPAWRQQFAKMVVLALGIPVSEADVCPFADVEVGGAGTLYPDNYVAAAAEAGVIRGTDTGVFEPRADVTRIQAVVMVTRRLETLAPGVLTEAPSGPGAPRSTWGGHLSGDHLVAAARAEAAGLLDGLPLAGLDPWSPMPRGELAQLLWNCLRLVPAEAGEG